MSEVRMLSGAELLAAQRQARRLRCKGCGFETRVVRRRMPFGWVDTTEDERLPLGCEECNRCWWRRRLAELGA